MDTRENNMQLYDTVEAAAYLDLSIEKFLTYANESGKLAYKLILGNRLYSREELDRFRKEDL